MEKKGGKKGGERKRRERNNRKGRRRKIKEEERMNAFSKGMRFFNSEFFGENYLVGEGGRRAEPSNL